LPNHAKEARERVTHRLSALETAAVTPGDPGVFLEIQDIKTGVETVLSEMHQQHFNQLDLHLLIACACRVGTPELWAFSKGAFHTVDQFEFLGVGDSSLIRYLQQIYSPVKDSLEDCENTAVYCIEKAKKYIDGCGGPTEIVSLQSHSKWRSLTESEIQERVDVMELRERELLRKIVGLI
jgi:20S proteasome alpha/beta subunit